MNTLEIKNCLDKARSFGDSLQSIGVSVYDCGAFQEPAYIDAQGNPSDYLSGGKLVGYEHSGVVDLALQRTSELNKQFVDEVVLRLDFSNNTMEILTFFGYERAHKKNEQAPEAYLVQNAEQVVAHLNKYGFTA